MADRPHGGMGFHQFQREGAGADHQQALRIRPRQIGGGERRGRGAAAPGEVDDRRALGRRVGERGERRGR